MALINKISNSASVTYNGETIESNTVETLLLLAPTLLMAVDKPTARVGETLTYTITVTNVAIGELTNLPFTDVLPDGCSYVADSFKVNGTAATPTVADNTLTYTIPTIGSLATAVIQFQVKVDGGEN